MNSSRLLKSRSIFSSPLMLLSTSKCIWKRHSRRFWRRISAARTTSTSRRVFMKTSRCTSCSSPPGHCHQSSDRISSNTSRTGSSKLSVSSWLRSRTKAQVWWRSQISRTSSVQLSATSSWEIWWCVYWPCAKKRQSLTLRSARSPSIRSMNPWLFLQPGQPYTVVWSRIWTRPITHQELNTFQASRLTRRSSDQSCY